ncbi:UDP-N-acetylmuramate dehydrogenase [Thalassotalea euphylliae]|uniref:UDP-N-acetylmuramate dehydrogenase n=1 Tax=Thalassotalea euphylliae TaxID=1655234 RepID=UPI00363F24E6
MSQFSTLELNSFAIEAKADDIITLNSVEELHALDTLPEHFYILGEGSNTLFVDSEAPTLIRPLLKGIKVSVHDDCYVLDVGAGENWHSLVKYTVEQGMAGLENLALIPGSVGAAPVQNIGAYGVELSQYCLSVEWFDFVEKKVKVLPNKDCKFAYRNSVFKNELKNKGVITGVTLSLPKAWQPCLKYRGLDHLSSGASAREVMEQVIEVRNSKLPNPKTLPNAGSFFKNPIISSEVYRELQVNFPDIVSYPQSDGKVKLAAGWLIEHAGLKGYKQGGVGVHDKQALVLVNFDSQRGADIAELARLVIKTVQQKFNVTLEPEVRLIGAHGETTL